MVFVNKQPWVQKQSNGIEREMKPDRNVHFHKMIGIMITFVKLGILSQTGEFELQYPFRLSILPLCSNHLFFVLITKCLKIFIYWFFKQKKVNPPSCKNVPFELAYFQFNFGKVPLTSDVGWGLLLTQRAQAPKESQISRCFRHGWTFIR